MNFEEEFLDSLLGRRSPHSSPSPGKPDTWRRGTGGPGDSSWRYATCVTLKRRCSSLKIAARMPRRDPCWATDTETDRDRQIGPLESRILGNVVSPVRRGADGKGTQPVHRHCLAYGPTNPGTSRSLASRPPYRTDFEVTPIRPTIAIQDHLSESRLRSMKPKQVRSGTGG